MAVTMYWRGLVFDALLAVSIVLAGVAIADAIAWAVSYVGLAG
jgi:hypothetical protein